MGCRRHKRHDARPVRGNPASKTRPHFNFFVGIGSIFFSGIFFSIEALPDYLINISNNLPLTISLEISKEALFGSLDLLDVSQALLKVSFISIFFLPTGIFLVYYSLKVAKINGSLNHY